MNVKLLIVVLYFTYSIIYTTYKIVTNIIKIINNYELF